MPEQAPPRSYKDSSWAAIEAPLEKKYGLPAGGLAAIRTRGERSNSDQVSPVGASTVYQIMPKTASGVKAQYGIDAFSGAHGSAEAAALVLRDGMRRTGSWGGSVAQYIGGTNNAAHGPVTRAYVARVTGQPDAGGAGGTDEDVYRAPAPMSVDQIMHTRPDELKAAGRELPHVQPNPNNTGEASHARMIDLVTGGGLDTPGKPQANQSGLAPVLHSEAATIRTQAKQDSYGFLDRQEAAWHQSVLGHIVHSMDEGYTPKAEADFHDYYVNNREKIEDLATNDKEVDWLRTATSRENLVQIAHRIGASRKSDEILNSGGGLTGFLQQTATDLVDPVGLLAAAATGGVTKGLGVGSAALKAAGRTGAAVASFMGENAAANIGITGILQASGEHETVSDYAAAGFMGAGVGMLLAPLHIGGIRDNTAVKFAEGQEAEAGARKQGYTDKAAQNLGPDAHPEDVANEANRLETHDTQQLVTGLLDEVPDEHRLLAPAPPEGSPEAATGEHGFITADKALKDQIIGKYHLGTTVSDDGERNLIAEMVARGERFDTANPIGEGGTSTVLQKGGLESVGMRLRNSESPVLRAVGGMITESTTGAGGRRYNAAFGKAVRERLYDRQIMRYEDMFHLFRQEQKVGSFRAFLTGDVRKQFDNRVFDEVEARAGTPNGESFDTSLSVRQAADMHERGYQLMADDQRSVGTIGAGRLAKTSRGYVPHSLSARKVAALKPGQRAKAVEVYARQLVAEHDFDKKFSTKLAKHVLERANAKVYGSYDVPFNLHSPEGADIVRDVLEKSGLTGDELTNAIGKFSRGGAQHTKQRFRLDLNADLGEGMKLRDLYNTDMVALFRGQSRRVAGEAALARFGIMGKHGLAQARKAAEVTGASAHDMEAFDQVAAEFLNTPFGSHNHLYMDNARLATSVSRLGGMGVTQFAEYGNGLAAVGAHGTLEAIGGFRRLAAEVHSFAKGGKADNPLLNSLDEMGGPIGLDDYQQSRLFTTPDNDIPMYGAETLGLGTRSLRGAAHLQSVLSAWRMITAVQTRGFSEQMLKRTVRYVKSGGEDAALRDIGITPELQARLAANLSNIAGFTSGGKLSHFDIHAGDLTNHEMNTLRTAIERSASQIIQRTYVGETGKWAHDGALKILAQFRTFSITSVEKQWGRNVKNYGALKSATYLLGAMSVAAPIYIARVYGKMIGMTESDKQAYAQKNLSAYAIGRATMNYASSSGLVGDVMDFGTGAYSSLTGDEAGLADFTGAGGKGSGGGKLLGGMIAPSIGLINDLASGLSDIHSPSGRKKLIRALPGAAHPAMLPLLNLANPEANPTKGL